MEKINYEYAVSCGCGKSTFRVDHVINEINAKKELICIRCRKNFIVSGINKISLSEKNIPVSVSVCKTINMTKINNAVKEII